jgi:hypothetical protein
MHLFSHDTGTITAAFTHRIDCRNYHYASFRVHWKVTMNRFLIGRCNRLEIASSTMPICFIAVKYLSGMYRIENLRNLPKESGDRFVAHLYSPLRMWLAYAQSPSPQKSFS